MHSYSLSDPELSKLLLEQLDAREIAKRQKLTAELEQPGQHNPDLPKPEALGPTGRFPEGKLTEADEGETRFQIGVVKGAVVLNFGSPIQAIGLNPSQALDLADLLRKHAKTLLPKKNHNGRNRGK